METAKEPTKYKLVEIFESVKGEGVNTGIPMMFIRFAGCNLNCKFCDTPFDAQFDLTEKQILTEVRLRNPAWVVFTGGEPSLQLTMSLAAAVKKLGIKTALETNGIEWNDAFFFIDYITISPKDEYRLAVMWHMYHEITGRKISEIRYIVKRNRQTYIHPIESEHVCLSPMFLGGRGNLKGGPDKQSLQTAINAVKENCHLGWRLSVQVHKLIGVQ